MSNRNLMTSAHRIIPEMRGFALLLDASALDFPALFASRSFYTFTDYTSDDVIGHNGKFMHGCGTDRRTVETIRMQMTNGRPVAGTLLNYKKCGEPFFNYQSVRPVYDSDRTLYRFSVHQYPICEHLAHLQMVFGLTLSETLLADMLCHGTDLTEASHIFDVVRQTIRTWFESILVKTGCTFLDLHGTVAKIGTGRQRELVSQLRAAFDDAQTTPSCIRPNGVAKEMLRIDRRGYDASEHATRLWLGWTAPKAAPQPVQKAERVPASASSRYESIKPIRPKPTARTNVAV